MKYRKINLKLKSNWIYFLHFRIIYYSARIFRFQFHSLTRRMLLSTSLCLGFTYWCLITTIFSLVCTTLLLYIIRRVKKWNKHLLLVCCMTHSGIILTISLFFMLTKMDVATQQGAVNKTKALILLVKRLKYYPLWVKINKCCSSSFRRFNFGLFTTILFITIMQYISWVPKE
jgi:hypothetical protein